MLSVCGGDSFASGVATLVHRGIVMVVTETLTSHPDQADFDANRAFWSGQAAAAKAARAARQELFALKGQTVVVVKGRKVPIGTTGVCFYSGEGRYGWRVGFETAAGETVWTDVKNVDWAK